jgi:hypothetical protein
MDTSRNPRKSLLKIASVLAEIPTQYLPNTSLQRYRYANLLGDQRYNVHFGV